MLQVLLLSEGVFNLFAKNPKQHIRKTAGLGQMCAKTY